MQLGKNSRILKINLKFGTSRYLTSNFFSILFKLDSPMIRIQFACPSPLMPWKSLIFEMKSSHVTAAKLFSVDDTVLNMPTSFSNNFLSSKNQALNSLTAYLSTAEKMQDTKIPINPGMNESSFITKCGTMASARRTVPNKIGQQPE